VCLEGAVWVGGGVCVWVVCVCVCGWVGWVGGGVGGGGCVCVGGGGRRARGHGMRCVMGPGTREGRPVRGSKQERRCQQALCRPLRSI
jgi:hypothetical protein